MTAEAPALAGRRVALVPMGPSTIGALHALATSPQNADRWPTFGRAMTVDELVQHLWRLSDLQYVLVRRDDGEAIGLVQRIDDDPRSRTMGIGLMLGEEYWNAGWPLEGIVLFLDHVFCGLGYRKVYLRMAASSLRFVGAAVERWMRREATLERHQQGDDGYEDVVIHSIHRDDWDPEFAAAITGRRLLRTTP
jgi:RimJ/RimL family protein N-acetyltransferase